MKYVRGVSNDGDDDAGVAGRIFHRITVVRYVNRLENIQ